MVSKSKVQPKPKKSSTTEGEGPGAIARVLQRKLDSFGGDGKYISFAVNALRLAKRNPKCTYRGNSIQDYMIGRFNIIREKIEPGRVREALNLCIRIADWTKVGEVEYKISGQIYAKKRGNRAAVQK